MNTQNPILGAAGRPLFSVGGEGASKVSTFKDYHVSLEWLNEGRESEPIMVIWSAHGGRESGCFGICLSSIGKYADPSGSPTDEAFFEAFEALPTLGRLQSMLEVKNLVDTIIQFTPDLIAMPPSPMDLRRMDARGHLLEVTLKDENGKTVREDRI